MRAAPPSFFARGYEGARYWGTGEENPLDLGWLQTPLRSGEFSGVDEAEGQGDRAVGPQGDGLTPDQRAQLFWSLINQTLQGMPPQWRSGLLVLGVGSWTKPSATARDIDASFVYIGDANYAVANQFKNLFEYNLRVWSFNNQWFGGAAIKVFVDELSGERAELDYYRGPTGRFFVYEHAKNNNPESTFVPWLDAFGNLQIMQYPTETFWNQRGREVPSRICQASLFADDTLRFLDGSLAEEGDSIERALLVAKYVKRVEGWLKRTILAQWHIQIPVTDPNLQILLSRVECMVGPINPEMLDELPYDDKRDRVWGCLGVDSDEALQSVFIWYYNAAHAYFLVTSQQINDAEPPNICNTQVQGQGPQRLSVWDKAFPAPQYLLHATGHGTMDGPRQDDWYFLFPQASQEGKVELPDGSGGTFTYAINMQAGPYRTPREVCQAAQGIGLGNSSFSTWGSDQPFNCAEVLAH